mmetsp:Transcript_14477/g.21123  ORF Transcript_14477/g.21123 Transcript_14477/m.21123 type:complete len:215 (-) Transcript_14477:27-671(-)
METMRGSEFHWISSSSTARGLIHGRPHFIRFCGSSNVEKPAFPSRAIVLSTGSSASSPSEGHSYSDPDSDTQSTLFFLVLLLLFFFLLTKKNQEPPAINATPPMTPMHIPAICPPLRPSSRVSSGINGSRGLSSSSSSYSSICDGFCSNSYGISYAAYTLASDTAPGSYTDSEAAFTLDVHIAPNANRQAAATRTFMVSFTGLHWVCTPLSAKN